MTAGKRPAATPPSIQPNVKRQRISSVEDEPSEEEARSKGAATTDQSSSPPHIDEAALVAAYYAEHNRRLRLLYLERCLRSQRNELPHVETNDDRD